MVPEEEAATVLLYTAESWGSPASVYLKGGGGENWMPRLGSFFGGGQFPWKERERTITGVSQVGEDSSWHRGSTNLGIKTSKYAVPERRRKWGRTDEQCGTFFRCLESLHVTHLPPSLLPSWAVSASDSRRLIDSISPLDAQQKASALLAKASPTSVRQTYIRAASV